MSTSKKTFCIVAGASGGHLIPALVVARSWKEKNQDGRVLLFNTTKSLDSRVARDFQFIDQIISLKLVSFSKRPDRFLGCLFTSIAAFLRSFASFLRCRPVQVVSTGGLIAIPVAYAARVFRIPVVLYELNAIPGKASKKLARLASEIRMPFASAVSYFKKMLPSVAKKCRLVEYPLRFSKLASFPKAKLIGKINEQIETAYALEGKAPRFQLARKTLMIFGGSQGAQQFNEFMRKLVKLRKNFSDKIQVIHQIGSENPKRWMRQYEKAGIPAFVFGYTDIIRECYHVADLVVARGGAGSLFELASTKTKSLIIPLEAADGHQILNARDMKRKHPETFEIAHSEDLDGGAKKIASQIFTLMGFVKSTIITPARRAPNEIPTKQAVITSQP
ncbi:UDP-N-acetylglucosamine--N-acetylmuramyl-(pentapeptide) pyrophosphoryl-undecaprenol N-acetylglucosamine transferase [Candidatus Babeliales bacterium]|nr:UDP-N-acetylglucosamine--N-acetylmuramyl-(pentapeptide) pyrophosphoryl-undecaprenol N-acetylglucosamine transferase [Candidatus Babeliales bacterium]